MRCWAPASTEASKPEDLPPGVGLIQGFYQLSEVQASQILEMRLHRLTGLEQEKLTDEYKQLLGVIEGLIRILENPDVLLQVIRDELINIREEYGDERRTEIRHSEEDLDILDLIAPEDVVVTLSHAGYAKRQPVSAYRAQRRGGRGRSAAATKEEDFIDQLWLVNTHDTLLTFTSSGKVFWLPVHQLPEAGSNARGRRSSTGFRWKPASACRRCCRCANTLTIVMCSSLPATVRSRRPRLANSPSVWRAARSRSIWMKAMHWSVWH